MKAVTCFAIHCNYADYCDNISAEQHVPHIPYRLCLFVSSWFINRMRAVRQERLPWFRPSVSFFLCVHIYDQRADVIHTCMHTFMYGENIEHFDRNKQHRTHTHIHTAYQHRHGRVQLRTHHLNIRLFTAASRNIKYRTSWFRALGIGSTHTNSCVSVCAYLQSISKCLLESCSKLRLFPMGWLYTLCAQEYAGMYPFICVTTFRVRQNSYSSGDGTRWQLWKPLSDDNNGTHRGTKNKPSISKSVMIASVLRTVFGVLQPENFPARFDGFDVIIRRHCSAHNKCGWLASTHPPVPPIIRPPRSLMSLTPSSTTASTRLTILSPCA